DARAKAQTQTILPMIEQGLQDLGLAIADLTAIAFSRGPGSFSGVRLNAAVTQALARSKDVPVIPMSALEAVAQAADRLHGLKEVSAVLDARMSEVYIASYQLDAKGIMQPVDDEQLLSYAEGSQAVRFTPVGSGAELVQSETSIYKDVHATAQDIASIARAAAQAENWVSAELALPVYLRDNAWKKIPEQGKA